MARSVVKVFPARSEHWIPRKECSSVRKLSTDLRKGARPMHTPTHTHTQRKHCQDEGHFRHCNSLHIAHLWCFELILLKAKIRLQIFFMIFGLFCIMYWKSIFQWIALMLFRGQWVVFAGPICELNCILLIHWCVISESYHLGCHSLH